MKIKKVIWLDAIIDKIAWKHHVEPDEAIEALTEGTKFRFVEKGHRQARMSMPPWEKQMRDDIL